MKIEISNRWKNSRADFQSLELFTREVLRRAVPDAKRLSLVLLDDAGITALNREYFGKNRPTDVISFAYAPDEGEVFVNVERARRARRPSWELALYVAHGCDHFSGADDHTPAQRARMLNRERRWLRDIGKLADRLLEA